MSPSPAGALRVGILGASGYGGAGLIERLARHPEVSLSALGSRQYAGQPVEACWPQLAGLLELAFSDSESVIETSDVVFCATPHGATAPLVAAARAAGRTVIDLSADFRLPAASYAEWYREHPHPDLLGEARYGLVELHRDELRGAAIVATPGCNSTAAILALAPLAAAGLLGDDVVVNITTGVSGAGRAPSQGLLYSEVGENVRPYKLAGEHRHTAEIELTLGRLTEQGKTLVTHGEVTPKRVTFNPHLVPMTRGILATCTTRPTAALTQEALTALYRDFYAGDPLIRVQDALPETKAVWGSDRTLVSTRLDARTGLVVALAAIDNLGKGAAGQAVQGFNAAHGFGELLGLRLEGSWP